MDDFIVKEEKPKQKRHKKYKYKDVFIGFPLKLKDKILNDKKNKSVSY